MNNSYNTVSSRAQGKQLFVPSSLDSPDQVKCDLKRGNLKRDQVVQRVSHLFSKVILIFYKGQYITEMTWH